jgi:hypothetical protein
LDILFLLIENPKIPVNDSSEHQNNCLLHDEDDMNRKFKELMKMKRDIDNQIIQERMIATIINTSQKNK